MERRDFLLSSFKAATLIGGALVGAAETTSAHPLDPLPWRGVSPYFFQDEITESQSGDPEDDAPVETLLVKDKKIKKLYGKSTRDAKDPSLLAARALVVAKSYIGVTRANNPTQVTQFLNLFGFDIKYAHTNTYVPYCASGVGFVFCRAFIEINPLEPNLSFDPAHPITNLHKVLPDIDKHYFRPHPAVRAMKDNAITRGNWVAGVTTVTPQPGWLVLYDWKKKNVGRDGSPDHVGIVDHAESDSLHTVEFNTSIKQGNQSNGGAVAPKERSYSDVLGYIKTY